MTGTENMKWCKWGWETGRYTPEAGSEMQEYSSKLLRQRWAGSNSFWGWMSEKNPNSTTWLRWRSLKAPSHLSDAIGSPEITMSAVCKECQQFDRVLQTPPQLLQCHQINGDSSIPVKHWVSETPQLTRDTGARDTKGRKSFQLQPERDNHKWLQQGGHGIPGHVRSVCGAAHSSVSGQRGTKQNSSRAVVPWSQRMDRDKWPQHPSPASIFSIQSLRALQPFPHTA